VDVLFAILAPSDWHIGSTMLTGQFARRFEFILRQRHYFFTFFIGARILLGA
jgi:hypothetical protein